MILTSTADLYCELNDGLKAEEVLAPVLKRRTEWE